MIDFRHALKIFREETGLSLRELDALCGISYVYIQRLENKPTAAPTDKSIDALSSALKLSPQRKGVLKALLMLGPIPDALFEAMRLNPKATVDALIIAARVNFRVDKPNSPQAWMTHLDRIDIDILGNRTE